MASFDVVGGDQLLKAIHDWSKQSAKAVKEVLEAGGDAAVTQAKNTAAWSDQTGELRKGIRRSSVKRDGNAAYVEVYPNGESSDGTKLAEVGFVLEYGRAKPAPYYRKTANGKSKRYVVKPMAPRPWLRPVIEDSSGAIGAAMEDAWKGAMGNG